MIPSFKNASRCLGLAVAVSAFAASAFADTLTLTSGTYSNGGNGGAYTAKINNGPATNSSYNAAAIVAAGTFETFCLEPTEYFSSGGTYDYVIGAAAIGGANEAAGRNATVGDQLSLGTTWLYSQFAQGLLSASTYATVTRTASMLGLQRAFWYLEDDYTAYGSAANALAGNVYLQLVANLYGGGTAGLAAAQADAANGANGVWALNISTTANNVTTQNQSQLYYHVPEAGATVALIGIGMLGMLLFRRKVAAAK